LSRIIRSLLIGLVVISVAGCGNSGLFKNRTGKKIVLDTRLASEKASDNGTLRDFFNNADNPNVTVRVNKYIWNATLDVLSFMPIENADPFSGVISYGWGHPAGTSRQYRATVYIQDPALDARSLRVALVSRGGPASTETIRQIEDAILTRARQMRIADSKL